MGLGEVAGYIGNYGTTRVRKAVFVSALPEAGNTSRQARTSWWLGVHGVHGAAPPRL